MAQQQQHPPDAWRGAELMALELPRVLTGVPSIQQGSIALPKALDAAEAVKAQFPDIYALPVITFEPNQHPRTIGKTIRLGVVMGGGSAPGAVELIAGLYNYLQRWNSKSTMVAFKRGLRGLTSEDYVEINQDTINFMQKEGGMNVIGTGVANVGDGEEALQKAADICTKLNINGLVVIGGTRGRMTDIVRLAQHFSKIGRKINVIAVPKRAEGLTMGDRIDEITVSFGFDSIAKLYSMLVSNLHKDVQSARSSYHFVRLMGDENGSFMTLEAALHTHPNAVLIGEEVRHKQWKLMDLIHQICDVICIRAREMKNYGIVLMPEGILYFVEEMNQLLNEINMLVKQTFEGNRPPTRSDILGGLTDASCRLALRILPSWFLDQMIWQRNVLREVRMANVQVEKLIAFLCEQELADRKKKGHFVGKFAFQTHFFGYEARNQYASNFDAQLGYSLGHAAGALIDSGVSGYSISMRNLSGPVDGWQPHATPLTSMMMLNSDGSPIVRFGAVDIESYAFKALELLRTSWVQDNFRSSVGPLSEIRAICLQLNDMQRKHDVEGELQRPGVKLQEFYDFIKDGVQKESGFVRMRQKYQPRVPSALRGAYSLEAVSAEDHRDGRMLNPECAEKLAELFPNTFSTRKVFTVRPNADDGVRTGMPLRIGVVLSGGPAPGGHNVIAGIYDFIKSRNTDSVLLGFVNGPDGVLAGKVKKIRDAEMDLYRNQGGFNLIGTSRTKIETPAQFARAAESCRQHGLNSLIVCGGDDSNTNAAVLADYFVKEKVPCQVIGMPKTIDADLRSDAIEMSFGFDTTAKTYSALIANVMHEVQTRRDRWHFIRLMGRAASHITVECALQTHPNYTVVLEEVAKNGTTVTQIAKEVTDLVIARAAAGKEYGVVLIPEGLIEVTKDMRDLVAELNELMAKNVEPDQVQQNLTKDSAETFMILPTWIKTQLMSERDPHGNVRVSLIESERLVASLVAQEISRRQKENVNFHSWCHFFGYQGRCALTSNFDCNFCYVLGHLAGALTEGGCTGVIGAIRNLEGPVEQWELMGVPLISMMTIERRKGKDKPVIQKKLVDLDGPVYRYFASHREAWAMQDLYPSRGKIQHLLGVFDQLPTQTLLLEKGAHPEMPAPASKL